MIPRRLTPLIISLVAATPLAAQQAGESLDALAERLNLPAADAQPRPAPRTADPSVTAAAPDPTVPEEDVATAAVALVARTRAWLDAQDITPPPSGRPSAAAFDALFPLPDPAAQDPTAPAPTALPALPALPDLPARGNAEGTQDEATQAEGTGPATAPCGPGDPGDPGQP